MQRTHIICLIGSLLAISQTAIAADPQMIADPAVQVPAPVEAKRLPATTPAPAPAPQQKMTAPTKDKAGADKKAAGKKEKEKKPKVLARTLFGKAETASALAPRALGWYSKGCLSGGVHLADTGPDWQTMRLSRNRAWGHPKLIKLLKRFASESKQDGWTGLLVGDISQPRGGPMLSGHASHQVGLDADIWLTPMPNRVLVAQGARGDRRRRRCSTRRAWRSTPRCSRRRTSRSSSAPPPIRRSSAYSSIRRSRRRCAQAAGKDRAWLGKVRPIWGHNYHFHIRMGCPNGGCQAQPPVKGDDGCGKEVDNWLKTIAKSLQAPQPKPGVKIIPDSERRQVTMEQLPAECKIVLNSPGSKRDLSDEVASTPTELTDKK